MNCECGRALRPNSLTCAGCGRSLRLDANVTGVHIPDPPIEQWRAELKNRPKASPESMAEVLRESQARQKNQQKQAKKRVKKLPKPGASAALDSASVLQSFLSLLILCTALLGAIFGVKYFSSYLFNHAGYLSYGLIFATSVISVIAFRKPEISEKFKFQGLRVLHGGQSYRLLTAGFLHGDAGHLFFNMFSLASIGVGLEYQFNELFGSNGPTFFIALYLLALIGCNLPSLFRSKRERFHSSLGASGAVVGCLASLVVIAPSILIWGLIPGRYFLVGFLVVSYFLAKRGGSRINHYAHIYGAVIGLIFIFTLGKYYGIHFQLS